MPERKSNFQTWQVLQVVDLRSQPTPALSWLERWALRRMHPRKILIDSVGTIAAAYFLWLQLWFPALLFLGAAGTVSWLSVRKSVPERFADSPLGKLALLHLHPMNSIFQLIGIVSLVYGLWHHSLELTLLGVSFVLLGHTFGWGDVDRRFQ